MDTTDVYGYFNGQSLQVKKGLITKCLWRPFHRDEGLSLLFSKVRQVQRVYPSLSKAVARVITVLNKSPGCPAQFGLSEPSWSF